MKRKLRKAFDEVHEGGLPDDDLIGYNKISLNVSNFVIELISFEENIDFLADKSISLYKNLKELNK